MSKYQGFPYYRSALHNEKMHTIDSKTKEEKRTIKREIVDDYLNSISHWVNELREINKLDLTECRIEYQLIERDNEALQNFLKEWDYHIGHFD